MLEELTLDELGCRFQEDLWDTAVEDAVLEYRIEARRHGPIHAMLVVGQPHEPRFNLLLGAGQPLAVGHGHLADVSASLRALGVDHHIPVAPGLPEAEAAEDWLRANGYERRQQRARFIRDAAHPSLPEPPAIEVDELADFETEGECFSNQVVQAFGLNLSFATFYFDLPGKDRWRCYAAVDEGEAAIASAAMRIEDGVAQLGLDATDEFARGRGCQLALLHRRIADAARAGCHALVAETDESLDDSAGPSAAARNLHRAGFERLSLGTVWGPAPA